MRLTQLSLLISFLIFPAEWSEIKSLLNGVANSVQDRVDLLLAPPAKTATA